MVYNLLLLEVVAAAAHPAECVALNCWIVCEEVKSVRCVSLILMQVSSWIVQNDLCSNKRRSTPPCVIITKHVWFLLNCVLYTVRGGLEQKKKNKWTNAFPLWIVFLSQFCRGHTILSRLSLHYSAPPHDAERGQGAQSSFWTAFTIHPETKTLSQAAKHARSKSHVWCSTAQLNPLTIATLPLSGELLIQSSWNMTWHKLLSISDSGDIEGCLSVRPSVLPSVYQSNIFTCVCRAAHAVALKLGHSCSVLFCTHCWDVSRRAPDKRFALGGSGCMCAVFNCIWTGQWWNINFEINWPRCLHCTATAVAKSLAPPYRMLNSWSSG